MDSFLFVAPKYGWHRFGHIVLNEILGKKHKVINKHYTVVSYGYQ